MSTTNFFHDIFSFLFSNNVLDVTKSFSIVVTDPQDAVGLPESLLKLSAEAAAADDGNAEGSRLIVVP